MKLATIISQTPRLFVVSLLSIGCSAYSSTSDGDDPSIGDPQSGSGGEAAEIDGTGGRVMPTSPPSTSSLGGAGGAPEEEPRAHPLIGAGNYTAIDDSDPCNAAQHWELEVMLDMSQGALILKDGVVWEVTGPGMEHGWTMEMNAPPCTTPNTVCDDLVYEQLTTCTE